MTASSFTACANILSNPEAIIRKSYHPKTQLKTYFYCIFVINCITRTKSIINTKGKSTLTISTYCDVQKDFH